MPYREYAIIFNELRTDGKFDMKNLMKAGRVDIALNSIIQALFVSEKIRGDVILHLFFYGPPFNPRYIRITPKKDTPFSKKDLATMLKIALYKFNKKKKPIEVFPGVYVEEKYAEDFIEENKNKKLFLLDQNGIFIDDLDLSFVNTEEYIFFLGDHLGIPKHIKRYLDKKNAIRISLGKITYYTSQCLVILNFYIDKNKNEILLFNR